MPRIVLCERTITAWRKMADPQMPPEGQATGGRRRRIATSLPESRRDCRPSERRKNFSRLNGAWTPGLDRSPAGTRSSPGNVGSRAKREPLSRTGAGSTPFFNRVLLCIPWPRVFLSRWHFGAVIAFGLTSKAPARGVKRKTCPGSQTQAAALSSGNVSDSPCILDVQQR